MAPFNTGELLGAMQLNREDDRWIGGKCLAFAENPVSEYQYPMASKRNRKQKVATVKWVGEECIVSMKPAATKYLVVAD